MALDGSVVVVTGAGGALGQQVCRLLVGAGATAIAVDHQPEATAQLAADLGERCVPVTLDLLDETATEAWGRQLLDTYGRVDGLLHLVGGWRGGKGIVDADLADWDFLHNNLIRTLQHTSRALHDGLLASPHGRLAIISSTGVAAPTAKNAAYVAAKAASEAWTLAVADSFKDSNAAAVVVRVMALLTPAMREAKPDAKFSRYTTTADVADALLGLWDRPAADLNGTVIDLTA